MKKKDIIKLVKESVQEVRGHYGQHDYYGNNIGGRNSISGMPGVWEQNIMEYGDYENEIQDLKDELAQLYRDQEETAEPEGGPIQNAIGAEIEAKQKEIDQAINFTSGDTKQLKKDVPYDVAVGKMTQDEYDKHMLHVKYPKYYGPGGKKRFSTVKPDRASFEKSSKFDRKPNKNSFTQPKSFDPDTINLVREMLLVADIQHNELVGGYDEVSSYLDKRTGGTIIKFPHFNGPQGRGAMFGKETADQIERSKAQAKLAAIKTKQKFQTYVDDFEISDKSPAGVYGNAYLWIMFNDLAKDYTAPKGGTQSSQFEEIEEQAPPPPKKGAAPAGAAPAAPTDPDAKSEKRELDNLEKEKFNVRLKYLNKKKSKASAQAARQSSGAIKGIQKQMDQLIQQRSKVGTTPPASPQKENKIMKTNKLLSDYLKENKKSNLKSNLNEHQKSAKRQMLMEGALKQFFEMFDMGKTDEEIVLDYATKGVSVPEQFVKKARSQYETLSKLKTELEMSEKEFKNSASNIVNNPVTGEADMLDDDKQLASAITSEEI